MVRALGASAGSNTAGFTAPRVVGGERRDRVPAGVQAVVAGGGIAGIAAATVLAERGVRVRLFEREAQLGGRAGAFEHTLQSGARVQMERGFHAFFRQYYNLRALLRRVDPQLQMLMPLADYPILGPEGLSQSFANLPTVAPLHIMKLVWQSPYLGLRDLMRIDKREALSMLSFDPQRTYARYDARTARDYLDSLAFPERARRMLFDVFSHSFFNPETEMSAAELLMMFHFYFMANREGLIFDVVRRPTSHALFEPFAAYLSSLGVEVCTGRAVRSVSPRDGGGFTVEHTAGSDACDQLVLALDVAALKRLFAHSPQLGAPALRTSVEQLQTTRPFAVYRLWLDRQLRPERSIFAGTTGVGLLDNISLYDRFQDESRAWTAQHGGSVVELHAYALPEGADPDFVRRDLLSGLFALYPEARAARIVDAYFAIHADCPAFAPGSHARRPEPATELPDLALAGDFTRLPFPCALMERAAASGFVAANHLLARHDVAPEPLVSLPTRGLLAPRTPRHQSTSPAY